MRSFRHSVAWILLVYLAAGPGTATAQSFPPYDPFYPSSVSVSVLPSARDPRRVEAHVRFRWDGASGTSVGFEANTALEIELHFRDRCYLMPHEGRDHQIDPGSLGITHTLPGYVYADVWNYSVPASDVAGRVSAGLDVVSQCYGMEAALRGLPAAALGTPLLAVYRDPAAWTAAATLFIHEVPEDPDANFTVGVFDASRLLRGRDYEVYYPLFVVDPETTQRTVREEGSRCWDVSPSSQMAVRMQRIRNSCTFARGIALTSTHCPFFLGATNPSICAEAGVTAPDGPEVGTVFGRLCAPTGEITGTPTTVRGAGFLADPNVCFDIDADGYFARPDRDSMTAYGTRFSDCDDGTSTTHPGTAESLCSDDADNDCDTLRDCADSDCRPQCPFICRSATECDDRDACNGAESCVSASCRHSLPLTCDRDDTCDPTNGCVSCSPVGMNRDCYSGPAGTAGIGRCHTGAQRCGGDGRWGGCVGQVLPALDETCGNSVDDDCNGTSDDGCSLCASGDTRSCFTGPGIARGVGICSSGVQLCAGARWGVCAGETLPQRENCLDGLDNDCDGRADCPDSDCAAQSYCGGSTCTDSRIGAACNRGVGACQRTAIWACSGSTITCPVTPGSPIPEVCNNQDDDCDGSVDDGVTDACYSGPVGTLDVGVCRAGTMRCSTGMFGACTGDVRPAAEACTNGLDDDCDGSVDCADGNCSSTPSCRPCAANYCHDRGLASGSFCDVSAAVVCGVSASCIVETSRSSCATLYPHAAGSCFSGRCVRGSCDAGYADCDASDATGCEVSINTDLSNCGMCGNVCVTPAGVPACNVGSCEVAACSAGFGDCDGVEMNGCERDLRSDVFHCGTCPTICASGGSCNSGTCVCPPMQSPCAGRCLDTSSDPFNCGACGVPCAAGTTCVSSVCTDVCPSPQIFCGGGCFDPNTDVVNCGRCDNRCPIPANSGSACTTGVCGFVCSSGFGDCDGSAATGCELDVRSDPTNCGACGRTCGAAIACSTGVCGDDPVVEVANGRTHTCARRTSGRVVCWGSNGGALGDGTVFGRFTPVAVVGLGDALGIAGGNSFSCAARSGGSASCWGVNSSGQLGDGTTTDRFTPVPVAGLTNVVTVAAGFDHACALQNTGSVQCWGANGSGQLGDGTTLSRSSPAPVSGISDAVEVVVGRFFSCARRTGGGVVCWGANFGGQVGDGTTTERHVPTPVTGLLDAASIVSSPAAGHTCARRTGGQIVCWGDNSFGELGAVTVPSDRSSVPVVADVGAYTDIVQLALGESHTCGRRATGGVVCWGRNSYGGELGDGTTTDRRAAGPVVGAAGFTWLAAGSDHTCGVGTAGAVACWGWNGMGQLGDGTNADRNTAVSVIGL